MGIDFSFKNVSVKSLFEKHYLYFSGFAAFVLCFGYMTGSDWTWYEVVYNNASWDNFGSYGDEPAFYFLMLLFKKLGIGFFGFLISMKLIHFVITARLLKKLSFNYYLALFIYIAHYGLFMFIDNPLRYMIALNFIYIAIGYIYDGKKVLPVILAIIAIPFHYTTILFLPIIAFLRMRWSLKFILILSVSTLFLNAIFIASILSIFPSSIEYYIGYLLKIDSYSTIFTIGTIANTLQVAFVLYYKEQFEKHRNKVVVNAVYLYIFLFSMSLVIPVFFRFIIFVAPVYCAALSYLANSLFSNKLKVKKLIFAGYVIAYASYATIDTVTSKYAFLPYSNYVVYSIKGKIYDYGYRSTYNLDNFIEGKLLY